jgi:hypothetical protein
MSGPSQGVLGIGSTRSTGYKTFQGNWPGSHEKVSQGSTDLLKSTSVSEPNALPYHRPNQKSDPRYGVVVRLLGIVVVLFGIFFRIHQYLANRSLWLDEAMLALIIVRRPVSGLFEQLSYHQGAPIGFLLIEKLSLFFLGNSEYALRLFPIIAGIASIFLFYYLVTNVQTDLGGLLSLALFVVSDWLIYYSSEVKQYSSDVAIALLLYVISLPLFRASGLSRKHFILWGFVGGISLWFSHPAVFILLAISFGLAVHYIAHHGRNNIRWLTLGIGIWAVSLLLVYAFALRFLVEDKTLVEFWAEFFMPVPPWSKMSWIRLAGCDLIMEPISLPGCKLGTLLLILGAFSLLLSEFSVGLALALPFLITLSASALRLYPFGSRLILFLVPLVIILISEGVDRIRRTLSFNRWMAYGTWILLAVLSLIGPTREAFSNLIEPRNLEDIKAVLAYLQRNQVPGDQVCIDGGAGPAYQYYAPFYKQVLEPCVLNLSPADNTEANVQDIMNKTRPGRAWFLFSHKNDRIDVDPELAFLASVDRVGRVVDQYRASGASVYLAEINR